MARPSVQTMVSYATIPTRCTCICAGCDILVAVPHLIPAKIVKECQPVNYSNFPNNVQYRYFTSSGRNSSVDRAFDSSPAQNCCADIPIGMTKL